MSAHVHAPRIPHPQTEPHPLDHQEEPQWLSGEYTAVQRKSNSFAADDLPISPYQAVANKSPQVQQFRKLQEGVDQSPQVQEFRALQEGVTQAVVQRMEQTTGSGGMENPAIQKNRTGMPDSLKSGIENLSGIAMDDVRVHYNSDKPAQMDALAYAQGSEIHLGAGQEQHLPHEAWHVVQQKQGRVQPTIQRKGAAINDDSALEREADSMGAKALGMRKETTQLAAGQETSPQVQLKSMESSSSVVQRKMGIEFETGVQAFDMDMVKKMEASDQVMKYTPDKVGLNSEYASAKKYFLENFSVAQDRNMWLGKGIQIDSDNSKLEFVTEPAVPFDEFQGPLMELAKTADSLPPKLDKPALLESVLPNGKNQGPFYLFPYVAKDITFGKVTGNPQLTLGIPYHKLFDFMNFLSHYQMQASMDLFGQQQQNVKNLEPVMDKWANSDKGGEQGQKERKEKASTMKEDQQKALHKEKEHGFQALSPGEAKDFSDISKWVDLLVSNAPKQDKDSPIKIDKAEEARLKGILHMTGQYAKYACEYKGHKYKKIAFPVLLRTSFTAMFQALTPAGKVAFESLAPKLMAKLGYAEGMAFPGQNDPFPIMEWIASISNPQQRQVKPFEMEHAQNDNNNNAVDFDKYLEQVFMPSDMMTAPGAFTGKGHNTDKSMGSFPQLDQDKFGQDLVVVELRHIFTFVEKALHSFTPEIVASFFKDVQAFAKEGYLASE